MIKMKKLSATTFAMALSLGGLALGAGCEKGDKDKTEPAPSAGPTDPAAQKPAPTPDKPADPQGAAAQGAAAQGAAAQGAATAPAATDTPTHTLPAKEGEEKKCAGSPKGCGAKPPSDPTAAGAELKVEAKPTAGTKVDIKKKKVETKNPAPEDDGCGGCGAPPQKVEAPKIDVKAGGTVTTEKKPAENACSKKSCG